MISRIFGIAALSTLVVLGGCSGGGSDELPVPRVVFVNGGTSAVSPQFAALGGAVPAGVQVAFIGDVVLLRGANLRPNMRVFLGMNNQLARRPDSLLTTVRHLLPGDPFVYTDPVTGVQTTLEVEVPVEFTNGVEIRITIPAAVACSAAFTNPVVRLFGDAGSSFPEVDVYFIVGPRCIALTPGMGVDIGGFDVTVHGDFFSPWSQIAFRYVDPADGLTKVVGDTAGSDIEEFYVDRHTLVIPKWPGVVPNSTFGLARELEVDVLLFENIDAITGDGGLEPGLGGVSPCSTLAPSSADAPLSPNGVRNSEKADGFTFTPTGVTNYPSIAGIVPESGTEIGGNTVIIHGDQFDAFTTDISNPANPGIGIECPPDSGSYIPPLSAILVDRQTLAVVMPPCSVDIPETVNFCLRNKFSIDNPGGLASAGPENDCVVFEDIYTYIPIPPILPPVVTAIYRSNAGPGDPPNVGNDYGLQRFFAVGDWFDSDTTLNGGFEFLLPNGEIVQSLRTILHNRNLIEIVTRRLPESFYPLAADLLVGVRLRNVIGHADFEEAFTFLAAPDAIDPPALTELWPQNGSFAGGNQVMVFGSNFDTTTTVTFDGVAATDVQFVHSGLLLVLTPSSTASGGPDQPVEVKAVDDAASAASTYTYTESPDPDCPTLGALDPDEGSFTGGYDILAYGINLTPLTRVEFGVDPDEGTNSGNFSPRVFFLSSNAVLVEVPEALPNQIGATVGVGATDPLGGCTEVVKTTPFTYLEPPDCVPSIYFVDTTVEVPVAPTNLPALNVGGGDRMLVIGECFSQRTTFDIEKPQGSTTALTTTNLTVLTPNIAVMTSPASPDGLPGVADLQAHNVGGIDGNEFPVEYVQPGPPEILDVRNLDDGTTTAPIDGNDRLILFGDNFFAPISVKLTGCDLNDQAATISKTLVSPDVTLVEDHLVGVNIPPNTFCEGPLDIEVTTPYGTASVDNAAGDPIFMLIGPQPPVVTGVFESQLRSRGGQEVVFFGRNFTATTEFAVRSEPMAPGSFTPVLDARYVSETVYLVSMPALPGLPAPAGAKGDVRAEETDAILASKIAGDPFTVGTDLFRVLLDDSPMLLAVFPDHGFIGGGEAVLLLGAGFLKADGTSTVSDVRFEDAGTGIEVGDYTEAGPGDLPLQSGMPQLPGVTPDRGKYQVLNDHEILVITHAHDAISPEASGAPMDVVLTSTNGDSMLNGAYSYVNTPAVRTPFLLGITPNETRLDGGSSHLLSGGFLTEADRIILEKGATKYEIPTTGGSFLEVNDNFLVFVMPDLSGTFAAGDALDVYAEKDVGGGVLKSNVLNAVLTASFAGPPEITPTLSPSVGSAFGGEVVKITGMLFTTNSQVLFGTLPARLVVYDSPTTLWAVPPALPVDGLGGLDLKNITATNGKVDVGVFTQGGWAVLEEGYQFLPAAPEVDSWDVTDVPEGDTVRVHVAGKDFVPSDTTVTVPPGAGTISDIAVDGFGQLAFDYEAPTFASGTAGPLAVSITVATGSGGPAADTCDLDVHIDPVLDDCTTTYTLNSEAAPTVGVEDGALVKGTLTGKNFLSGGSLALRTRENKAPIPLTEVSAFTAGAQFMVDDDKTITFTVPNIFSSNVPTLLDGNPNIGPAQIEYASPFGRADDMDDCFDYVPWLPDFEQYAYILPPNDPEEVAWNLAVGDINADGVPDAAVLGTEPTNVWVMFANTFGPVDINGDGEAPDFAGTFTVTGRNLEGEKKFTVDRDPVRRGKRIRLANLDSDPELEILVPGHLTSGSIRATIYIIDVDSSGLGTETLYKPGVGSSSDLRALAVGDFDGDSRDDFAFITGTYYAATAEDRRLGIVTSPTAAFTFSELLVELPPEMDDFIPGELVSGDWDGDGDSDLMYGTMGIVAKTKLGDTSTYPVIVVEIDSTGPSVVSQEPLTNFNAGRVEEIEVMDADGDGKDDAVVLVSDAAHSDVFPEASKASGYAVVLDPLGLEADSYTVLLMKNRLGATGDFNADGIPDLALTRREGEFMIRFGDGTGGFVDSGRSWTLVSVLGKEKVVTEGIHAGDVNRDGMAELWMCDGGLDPKNVVLWLNTSR